MEHVEHLLFEHVSGYELFELKAFEGLSDESYADYGSLIQVARHISALPVEHPEETMLGTEHGLPDRLRNFLQLNRAEVVHADKSLRNSLTEAGFQFRLSPNIMRGVRQNASRLLKGAPGDSEEHRHSVLRVSHALARRAIKYDLERDDNFVIAAGYECDYLDDEIRMQSDRLAVMVDWVVPRFRKLVKREELDEKLEELLADRCIAPDGESAENALLGSLLRESIAAADPEDLRNLRILHDVVCQKKRLLSGMEEYLAQKMTALAPNLRCILGDRLCAKLIHKAGGLSKLALLPSSTLQLLGAEKALFQSLKMKRRTPKYGLLYNIDYLRGNRGRMCRYIAAKCALAARIDAYSAERTELYGREFKKLIERRMRTDRSPAGLETSGQLLERVEKKIRETSTSAKSAHGEQRAQPKAAAAEKKSRKRFYESTESSKRKAVPPDSTARGPDTPKNV